MRQKDPIPFLEMGAQLSPDHIPPYEWLKGLRVLMHGLCFDRKLLKYGGKVNTLLITQISKDDYADLPDFPMHFVSV